MSKTFTQAQVTAIVAQTVALTLAQLQGSAAPTKSSKPTKAEAARKAARAAKQAEGLAKVRGIAEAKATKGKVQLTAPEHLQLARTLLDVPIPLEATRFTLSIGDKGWAFAGPAGAARMQEVPVTPEQAAELRAVFDALVVRKVAQA